MIKNKQISKIINLSNQIMKNQSQLVYPPTKRDEKFLDDHKLPDPYRWLENSESPEVQEWVSNQNILTDGYLSQYEHREKLVSKLNEIYNYEKYMPLFKRGDNYYFKKNDGLQNQYVLYTQKSLHDTPEVFIDPNTLSEDGTTYLGVSSFSNDGKLFAYGLKKGGSDWTTIYVKNVETKQQLADKLEFVKFSSYSWTHDNKGFFYNTYPKPKNIDSTEGDKAGTETDSNLNQKVMYHVVGTHQSEDILIYENPSDPEKTYSHEISNDGKYLILYTNDGCSTSNKFYYASLENFKENSRKLQFVKLIDEFVNMFEYITNVGNKFYLISNCDEAKKNKVICIDLDKPEKQNWSTLIDEDKGVLSEAYLVYNDKLLLIYNEDVHDVMRLYDLKTGKFEKEIPTPSLGTVQIYKPQKEQEELFYLFTSFLYPNSIYEYNYKTGNNTLFKASTIQGFDPEQYETKQVFFENKNDKTKIPMFIITKKGSLDNGPQPLNLIGYGGFNISYSPFFSPFRVVLMKHLGINFAIANIRGGGEYGQEWHYAGTKENKQNVFNDFQSAGEYLIENKYTSPQQLIIQGGSNGGLLVGACINQRPDLFKAGIAQVGVLDMLRFHKFTIGHAWCSDYGNPDNEEDFKYIIEYSPVHNVNKNNKPYPAVLLTTGDHDDRVVPLHSYKYIATLQHELGNKEYQKEPLLIKVDTKAGHGEGKPTQKVIEETADIYSFMSLVLKQSWNA
ncbi:hypothetical protein PPERSA_02753 [Pseudocohnilembus persalinus]|uniref:Prolyl endopeptidase n=1 Tax=Pseudocohnilembus persalinus TaxID=266149 RepID=A0A0V0R7J8_PSEPJ|nr:hypothetical protein PPERSA_02753 [Pseudocohnilembus persalinus]|eukprot:KRX10336.1 hypothetical protein PPERSA_02753 [Pseudocohnilembus persalinus]